MANFILRKAEPKDVSDILRLIKGSQGYDALSGEEESKGVLSRSDVLNSVDNAGDRWDGDAAARIIGGCWRSYRDKRLFRLLKHTVCAAEHCLTYEIIRKVSPSEAELLKDRSMQCKVRFRQDSVLMSPSQMIFIVNAAVALQQQGNGSVLMGDGSTGAAVDACRMMGHRRFFDQIILDEIQRQRKKIVDKIDVTSLKEYMQSSMASVHRPTLRSATPQCSSRRSDRARRKAAKMRRLYGLDSDPAEHEEGQTDIDPRVLSSRTQEESEQWEEEADRLYTWTQELSLEDLGVASPSHNLKTLTSAVINDK
ncbi:UNVERIFIED_CONTAM: hypothetical protein FKN15_006864 [Acipenser sinensis]